MLIQAAICLIACTNCVRSAADDMPPHYQKLFPATLNEKSFKKKINNKGDWEMCDIDSYLKSTGGIWRGIDKYLYTEYSSSIPTLAVMARCATSTFRRKSKTGTRIQVSIVPIMDGYQQGFQMFHHMYTNDKWGIVIFRRTIVNNGTYAKKLRLDHTRPRSENPFKWKIKKFKNGEKEDQSSSFFLHVDGDESFLKHFRDIETDITEKVDSQKVD